MTQLTALQRAIWHMIEANRSIAYDDEPIAYDMLETESRQWDTAQCQAFIEKWSHRYV